MSQVPVIKVGKYAGTPIDQLPNSYLRWMITQKLPKEWVAIAHEKLAKSSGHVSSQLSITRHAIDMFSLRFLNVWAESEAGKGDEALGLASFMAKLAQEAWEKGEDISKYRHMDDGTVKLLDGIKWVFNVNADYPEYKDVITVMNGMPE